MFNLITDSVHYNKIIFLDFDGVLNTEHYQGLLQYQGKPWQDEYGAFFDPKAVKRLKKIIGYLNMQNRTRDMLS